MLDTVKHWVEPCRNIYAYIFYLKQTQYHNRLFTIWARLFEIVCWEVHILVTLLNYNIFQVFSPLSWINFEHAWFCKSLIKLQYIHIYVVAILFKWEICFKKSVELGIAKLVFSGIRICRLIRMLSFYYRELINSWYKLLMMVCSAGKLMVNFANFVMSCSININSY